MNAGPPVQPGLMDNLKGAVAVMLGQESGLRRMDLTAHGFAWSFSGLLLTALIDISGLSALHANAVASGDVTDISKPAFIAGKLFASSIAYLAAMLALYLLCRSPAEQARFPTAVIVHNWAAPIVSLAMLPLLFAAASSPSAASVEGGNPLWTLATIGITALLILIGIRLIRIALDIQLSRALLYFALTTAISLVAADSVERLIGL